MRRATACRSAIASTLVVLGFSLIIAGCDTAENPLAPYEGSRPLFVQQITSSYAPDLSWVGGRVAAIGINRGETAALDSTLVWMHSAEDNSLGSPVYVRDMLDEDEVTKVGGTPSDSLEAGVTYTLWMAEKEAFDAGLSGAAVNEFTFADTTFTTGYLLSGRSAGGVDVDFRIFRDQRLASDQYTVTWTPASQAFRRVAIRHSSAGGFTNLLWHVVLPDEQEDSITSPLTIGEPPPESVVATPWSGFESGIHVFWAATSDWDGENFGFSTPGYAFFTIFANNFE